MSSHLCIPGEKTRSVNGFDDPVVAATPGPAVLFDGDSDTEAIAGRPRAYREGARSWNDLDFEAADLWQALSEVVRQRLLADPRSSLDTAEFKAATGASASIISANWVYTGSPREYRVAGPLREFIEVLAKVLAD